MLRSWNLRRTNNLLLSAIIVINLYVVVAPFYPAIVFWWQREHSNRPQQLSELVQPKSGTKAPAAPSVNSVVVPSMLLNTPILTGTIANEYKTLDKGVWIWPKGSTPDKGGNTILIGHRFTYTNPRGIFYELNQVKVGDPIAVFWNGTEYLYTVSTVSVVSPSDVAILNPTQQAEVTLYTCTPTWNPINRLVVVANLTSTRGAVKS